MNCVASLVTLGEGSWGHSNVGARNVQAEREHKKRGGKILTSEEDSGTLELVPRERGRALLKSSPFLLWDPC